MNGVINRAAPVRQAPWARRAAARALLGMSAVLRRVGRRLQAAQPAVAPPQEADAAFMGRAHFTRDRVFWGLVRKDLYFSRIVVVAGLVTAGLGLLLQRAGGNVAALIVLYCAAAAPAAFLCLALISAERQERSHLFVLSLPISPTRYLLAKVVAVTAAFAIGWLLLAALIGLPLAFSGTGAGLLPYVTVVWVFVLDLYAGLLAVVVASQSAAMTTTAMILFNVSPPLFFNYVAQYTSPPPGAPPGLAVWTPYAVRAITIECAIAAVFFALTLWTVFRRRDQA